MAASQTSTVDPTLGDIVGNLKNSAGDYARAEFDLVKAKAGKRVAALKMTVIFGVIALLLVQALLVTLLVGMVWVLAPLVGPAIATIIVVIVAAIVAFILVKSALAKLNTGEVTNA